MENLTNQEFEDTKDACCENSGCKGRYYVEESECWKDCSGFRDTLKEIREEAQNDTTTS